MVSTERKDALNSITSILKFIAKQTLDTVLFNSVSHSEIALMPRPNETETAY